nr:hypothetical protein [Tanacetum cinerariifolium]
MQPPVLHSLPWYRGIVPLAQKIPTMLAKLLCRLVRPGDTRISHGYLACSEALIDLKPIRQNRKSNSFLRRHVTSRMKSLWVGDDGSGGDGILGRGDDKGDSRDSGGDGGVGAASHASTCAAMDGGKGV